MKSTAEITAGETFASSDPDRSGFFGQIDRVLEWGTELGGAVLLLVEIVVLSVGVISRYFFEAPQFWVDEVASLLFLWLATIGAVIALRRGEHMRLSIVVNSVAPETRLWLESIGCAIVGAFLLALWLPSYEHWESQRVVSSAALDLSDGLRVAAFVVGVVLMSLITLMRLFATAGLRRAVVSIAIIVCVGILFWLAKPSLMAMGILTLPIFFLGMLALCVVIGVPIAFAFGVSTVAYLAFSTRLPLQVVVGRMDEGMSNYLLLAVPMFVFLGLLIEMTGLARAIVDLMAALVGRVRGGLSYVLLSAMYLVSGISGSKAADMAAVAPGLLPEMKRRGQDLGELAALLSASGAMTETIPPSLVLIMVGAVTGVSIAALFTGGLLPALICGIALGVVAYFRSGNEDLDHVKKASRKEIFRAFLVAIPALILPFIIRSAVVEGVATATEVAVVGILYTIIVGPIIYRQFDFRRVYPALVSTVALSGAVLIILGAAAAMAWALTQAGFSRQLMLMIKVVPGGAVGFLLVSIALFVILGSVLEGLPAILVFGPLLFPVAKALGINEVHYAMVMIIAMGIGLFSPPFGIGYFAACGIARASPDDAMKRIWPYMAALLAALLVITFVPWISVGFL